MTNILISAVYVFFLVSFLASSATEALSSLFGWRPAMLLRFVQTILDDKTTNLASELYANALVNPRAESGDPETKKTLPSYIDPWFFAIALVGVLNLDQSRLNRWKTSSQPQQVQSAQPQPQQVRSSQLQQVKQLITQEIVQLRNDARLGDLLADTIIRREFDVNEISASIARWFDSATDRLTGTYKRRTQLSNFLFGLVIAVVFDVNPLPPALTQLTPVPAAPASVSSIDNAASVAQAVAPSGAPPAQVVEEDRGASPSNASTGASSSVGSDASANRSVTKSWAAIFKDGGIVKAIGWFVAALSTVLGAPFWFDILSKVTNIGGTKPDKSTAAEMQSASAQTGVNTARGGVAAGGGPVGGGPAGGGPAGGAATG